MRSNGHDTAHLRPDADHPPRKRQRTVGSVSFLNEAHSVGQDSPEQTKRSVDSSGRPNSRENGTGRQLSHHHQKRYDSYQPYSRRNTRTSTNDDSSSPNRQQTRNVKTKRDRKENPSTRIHSLRKLVARKSLPPHIQIEKERELASLIFTQTKERLKSDHAQNLKRYHFVRFIERQKAERLLKKLRKWKERGLDVDDEGNNLDEKIEETEIDLNYAQYAPLGDKYIGVFSEQVSKGKSKGKKHGNLEDEDGDDGDHDNDKNISKASKYKGNWKLTPNIRDLALLTPAQRKELELESQEAAGILELNTDRATSKAESRREIDDDDDSDENENSLTISKPPVWYEVKAAMALKDTDAVQKALDKLRDRSEGVKPTHKEMVLDLKAGSNKRNKSQIESDDDGDEDVSMGGGGVSLSLPTHVRRNPNHTPGNGYDVHRNQQNEDEYEDEDTSEDMSDGDGGFFEKRWK